MINAKTNTCKKHRQLQSHTALNAVTIPGPAREESLEKGARGARAPKEHIQQMPKPDSRGKMYSRPSSGRQDLRVRWVQRLEILKMWSASTPIDGCRKLDVNLIVTAHEAHLETGPELLLF